MRILLVEDDAMVGKALTVGLVRAGFALDWVTDGRSAELALGNGVYDLAILDLGLPKKTGWPSWRHCVPAATPSRC